MLADVLSLLRFCGLCFGYVDVIVRGVHLCEDFPHLYLPHFGVEVVNRGAEISLLIRCDDHRGVGFDDPKCASPRYGVAVMVRDFLEAAQLAL